MRLYKQYRLWEIACGIEGTLREAYDHVSFIELQMGDKKEWCAIATDGMVLAVAPITVEDPEDYEHLGKVVVPAKYIARMPITNSYYRWLRIVMADPSIETYRARSMNDDIWYPAYPKIAYSVWAQIEMYLQTWVNNFTSGANAPKPVTSIGMTPYLFNKAMSAIGIRAMSQIVVCRFDTPTNPIFISVTGELKLPFALVMPTRISEAKFMGDAKQ